MDVLAEWEKLLKESWIPMQGKCALENKSALELSTMIRYILSYFGRIESFILK